MIMRLNFIAIYSANDCFIEIYGVFFINFNFCKFLDQDL